MNANPNPNPLSHPAQHSADEDTLAAYDWDRESQRREDSPVYAQRTGPTASVNRNAQWSRLNVPVSHHTFAVWLIVFLPYVQLVACAAVFMALTMGDMRLALTSLAFYLLVFLLAIRDSAVLQRLGFARPPQSAWALLGPLPYLIARTVAVKRELDKQSSPLWIWLLNVLVCASITVGIALTVGKPYLQTLGLVFE